MIGLFFEVTPREGHAARYFELAAALKPELDRNGGVLFADRYTSIDRPGVVLSHQWWDSEEALIRWRGHAQHRAIQRAGREQHFSDYRIRIGWAIEPSEIRAKARSVSVSYYDAEPVGRPAGELYKGVYREGKFLVLGDGAFGAQDNAVDTKTFEIIRDYTMYDRAEAPQQYPPVERRSII
jgi:heme-degrading monooxygenase HmoA